MGLGAACAATIILAAGCASPLQDRSADGALRRAMFESIRQELTPPIAAPQGLLTTRPITVSQFIEDLALEGRIEELNALAGPDAYNYDASSLPLGTDLQGRTPVTVGITLEEVIRMTVENNLQVQFARLSPAITQTQVERAEAAFDWTFFSNLEWEKLDQPIVDRSTTVSGLSEDFRQEEIVTSTSGFRRNLVSGGQFTFQHRLRWANTRDTSSFLAPDPAKSLETTFQFDQPLLRGFGSDLTMAQIRLAQNAEREAISRLKGDLIRMTLEAEREYWNLVRAHRQLLILQRLVVIGQEVYEQVKARARMDAVPAQISEAAARVEDRKTNVLRGANELRRSSDRLKALINDPRLVVSSEVLLLPMDAPADEPVRYSIADALATALEHRPEIDQAILSIDDASIRKVVADNARLPRLDLRLQMRLNALRDDFQSAYYQTWDRKYIDYVAGVFFEYPIGNREAEAEFRQRVLERQQAVISFRNTVQQVALELKNSLDNTVTNYQLIEQSRIARITAAEGLRAFLAEKRTIAGFTVERLEIELNRQERLAAAEQQEVQALADYQVSIAELYAAMGISLERNRIEFVAPDNPGLTFDK